jgi:Retroviral aspartyl protease
MLVSSSLSIEHVQVAQIEKNMMTVDILILRESLGQKKIVETTILLDTGAGGKFINQNFVRNQKIETKELKYRLRFSMWMEPQTNKKLLQNTPNWT